MPRLHLLPETPPAGPVFASAAIRLLNPWRHPALGRGHQVSAGPRLPPGRLDAVVTQRGGPLGATLAEVQALVAETRARGARLILDLDDDLLAEHPAPQVEAELAAGDLRPRLRFLARAADAVIVSTPALAARLGRLNPAVHVWANALDERLARPGAPEGGEGAELGYFGTLSHLPDLMAVVGPLQAALARRPARPRVELCGIAADPRLGQVFAGVAEVTLLPAHGDYAGFLAARQAARPWAAGIAPLVDCPFNRAKSDIKFLDHALFGTPGIYPDLPVYAAVQPGETGLLAPLAGFGEALARLLDDPGLRRRIRRQARDWVLAERVLARRAPDLGAILGRVLDRAAPATAA